MAIVALGRAAFFLVATFTRGTVSSLLVNLDFGRSAFVASSAIHLLAVSFVVKCDSPFFVLIGDRVSSISYGESERDQHDDNNQFFHVSLSLG